MKLALKIIRVAGSMVALTFLYAAWAHYELLTSTFGGLVGAYHRIPDIFLKQFFGVFLPYNVLLLLIALPFSRITRKRRWRVAFCLLIAFSIYGLTGVMADFPVYEWFGILLIGLFLVSQPLAIWLQWQERQHA